MTIQLLPNNFEQLVTKAIQVFWATRKKSKQKQVGQILRIIISLKSLI